MVGVLSMGSMLVDFKLPGKRTSHSVVSSYSVALHCWKQGLFRKRPPKTFY